MPAFSASMCTTKTVTFFSFRTHTAFLHPVSIFQRTPVSDEPEIDDIDHVEQDDDGIGNDIIPVNDFAQQVVINQLERQAVVENDRKVGVGDDHEVETHAHEIKPEGLAQSQMMEKLQVEHINQPTADGKEQKNSQQSEYQLYRRNLLPSGAVLLFMIVTHD